MDRECLHVGDEILCKRCLLWHPTYQPLPDDPRDYVARMLYYDCPESVGGQFYGGRVGEPPQDPERWRRAPVSVHL
jgi:hypothetical protein